MNNMLNKNAQLNTKLFDEDVERAPTRDGFGKGTVEAGEKEENVAVPCADLADSNRAGWFKDKFPKR